MAKGGNSKKGLAHVKLTKTNIPVGKKRRELVRAISDNVTHSDYFSSCISWIAHKKAHRAQDLLDSLKFVDHPRDIEKLCKEKVNVLNDDWNSMPFEIFHGLIIVLRL